MIGENFKVDKYKMFFKTHLQKSAVLFGLLYLIPVVSLSVADASSLSVTLPSVEEHFPSIENIIPSLATSYSSQKKTSTMQTVLFLLPSPQLPSFNEWDIHDYISRQLLKKEAVDTAVKQREALEGSVRVASRVVQDARYIYVQKFDNDIDPEEQKEIEEHLFINVLSEDEGQDAPVDRKSALEQFIADPDVSVETDFSTESMKEVCQFVGSRIIFCPDQNEPKDLSGVHPELSESKDEEGGNGFLQSEASTLGDEVIKILALKCNKMDLVKQFKKELITGSEILLKLFTLDDLLIRISTITQGISQEDLERLSNLYRSINSGIGSGIDLSNLPDTLREKIFSYLSVEDLFSCRSVCWSWYESSSLVLDNIFDGNQREFLTCEEIEWVKKCKKYKNCKNCKNCEPMSNQEIDDHLKKLKPKMSAMIKHVLSNSLIIPRNINLYMELRYTTEHRVSFILDTSFVYAFPIDSHENLERFSQEDLYTDPSRMEEYIVHARDKVVVILSIPALRILTRRPYFSFFKLIQCNLAFIKTGTGIKTETKRVLDCIRVLQEEMVVLSLKNSSFTE